MIIRPVVLPPLALGESAPGAEPRSPGLHMSTIYGDLYADLEPKRFDKSKPMDMLRVEAGLAFEEALEQALAHRLGTALGGERPGEFMTVEGVAYTPDLIIFDDRGTVLGEIKVTWMSCRECPLSPEQASMTGLPSNWDGVAPVAFSQKFDRYFTQCKAYCFHLGTPHARLFVYFVNGDYRPPSPALLMWDFEFTERELYENWRLLLNHARSKGLLP